MGFTMKDMKGLKVNYDNRGNLILGNTWFQAGFQPIFFHFNAKDYQTKAPKAPCGRIDVASIEKSKPGALR